MAKIGDHLKERRYTHKLVCPKITCGADVLLMTKAAAHGYEAFAYSNTVWPDGIETKEGEKVSCPDCASDVILTQEYVRVIEQVIAAPRREHSRKPDEIHNRIEALFDGPYLELFARQKRKGWDCWGNETEKFEAEETLF